jgi:hypothetical protein
LALCRHDAIDSLFKGVDLGTGRLNARLAETIFKFNGHRDQ